MSTRLTQETRRRIAKKAKQLSPINKQLDDVKQAKFALAEKIRIASLGGKDKAYDYAEVAAKLMKIREDLPQNLITHSVGINMSNYITVEYKRNTRTHLHLATPAVSPTNAFDISGTNYGDSLIVLFDEEEKLNRQLSAVEGQVYASISGINTLKQLLEAWPEVVELLPEDLKQPKVRLPALRADNLNNLIGLPTDKKTNGAK